MEQNLKETRDELYELFKQSILERYGEFVTLKREPVLKNNNTWLDGVIVQPNDSNIAPTIYLDSYAAKVLDGVYSMERACDSMMNTYEKAQQDNKAIFDLSSINYENACQNLRVSIINADKNKELLADCPHELISDLAIICRYYVDDNASFIVHNNHLDILQMSPSEVVEIGKRNSVEYDKCQILRLSEVLGAMIEDDDCFDAPPLYFISNPQRCMGAVGVFIDSDVREDLYSRIGEDYYIIPSSTHEVMAIGKSYITTDSLKSMIQDVNATSVSQEEFLSNEPYFVNSEFKIRLANDDRQSDDDVLMQHRTHAAHM